MPKKTLSRQAVENVKQSVLLIDDNPANLELLGQILEKRGLEVMAVRSGEAGLALADSALPDLILLDVKMPGMDGFEVCRRLKKHAKNKDIPVIFTTILADLPSKVKGFECGAADYIAKPFEEEEVSARVEAQLKIRRLQSVLAAERQALADKNAELEAFAHTVAHHLKNPLAQIESLSRTLHETGFRNKIFAAQAERILPMIIQAARRGGVTVNALLKLAEISQAEFSHTLKPADVRILAESVVHELQPLLESAQGQIEFAPCAWPEVAGYAPWIQEIWRNYLENAVKYSGEPPHIVIGADTCGEWGEFWVQDNGPGLDAETQSLLFKPFIRLSPARADGHGLGLSIVARIARRLGGEAGVQSEPGKGCRFYFRLKIL